MIATRLSPSSRRWLALTAVLGMLLTILTGCTTDSPGPGELRNVNGGVQIIVPALWVDVATNSGGLEYTTVWVGHDGTAPLTVQLDDLQAEGAGSAWRAASASAAAVGTMMSGEDPTNINFNFDVSGPIDGPSAGAILTVGVLAALKNTPMKPTVTMTGTISPDGSIGTVAGIAAKMRAAADNGFTTVVLPQLATTVQPTGEGERVDTIEYGTSLGLSVVLAQNVSQAYEVFTGKPLFRTVTADYSLQDSPSLLSAQARSTQVQIEAARAATSEISSDDPLRNALDQELLSAEEAIAAGNMNAAFALAVDVLNQASREAMRSDISSLITAQGVSAASIHLSATITSDIASIDELTVRETQRVSELSASQTIFLPSALTWLSYARAVLVSLQPNLDAIDPTSATAAEDLVTVAGIVGEQMAGVNHTFRQNITMLDALPADTVIPAEPVMNHLVGYTDFLVEAGQQNENYLSGAFGLQPADIASMPLGSLLPVVSALSVETAQIDPATGSASQDVANAATALSYYATTSLLVSSVQALGIESLGIIETPSIQSPDVVLSSLNTGAQIVNSQASLIFAEGLQPGFASWSTAWGLEAFTTLSTLGRPGDGTIIALNEIWFDTVALFMLNALRVS